MNNNELNTILTKGGMSAGDIEKFNDAFDILKITEIIEMSSTRQGAISALHELYPQLDVEALEKQSGFLEEQFRLTEKELSQTGKIELTEEELDMVSGGGWWSDNWKKVLIGAAIVVGAALICTGVGAAAGALITSTSLSMVPTGVGAAFMYVEVTTSLAAGGAAIGAASGTVIGGVVAGVLGAKDII